MTIIPRFLLQTIFKVTVSTVSAWKLYVCQRFGEVFGSGLDFLTGHKQTYHIRIHFPTSTLIFHLATCRAHCFLPNAWDAKKQMLAMVFGRRLTTPASNQTRETSADIIHLHARSGASVIGHIKPQNEKESGLSNSD